MDSKTETVKLINMLQFPFRQLVALGRNNLWVGGNIRIEQII